MAERLEYAPAADTVDTNEKILNPAAEITGKPADLKTITGDKKAGRAKSRHIRSGGVSAGQALGQAVDPRRKTGTVRPPNPGELAATDCDP